MPLLADRRTLYFDMIFCQLLIHSSNFILNFCSPSTMQTQIFTSHNKQLTLTNIIITFFGNVSTTLKTHEQLFII